MARGRFISNSISGSKKFAKLENHTHRLMYLMLVPHVDAEGRHDADPRILNGQVYTLLGLTLEEVERGLADMHRVNLIVLYNIGDDRYLEVVAFHEHNKVRRDDSGNPSREAKSNIPPVEDGTISDPTAELLRSYSGPTPAQGQEQEQVEVQGQVQGQVEVKKDMSARADVSPTLEDLIEIWNRDSGDLRKVRDPEAALANPDLRRLTKAFITRHGPTKATELFTTGIPAVRVDPHWLGNKAHKPTRTGAAYGITNYLRHVETKAEEAVELATASVNSRAPTPQRPIEEGDIVADYAAGVMGAVMEVLPDGKLAIAQGPGNPHAIIDAAGAERMSN